VLEIDHSSQVRAETAPYDIKWLSGAWVTVLVGPSGCGKSTLLRSVTA
jgi:ABC-type sugar transport system ATPase subunit